MMRSRRPRLAAATVMLMLFVVASCSGGGGHHAAPTTTKGATTQSVARATLQSRADDVCRRALRGEFLNAQPTTVGEARTLEEGGIVGTHPLAHAFRGAPTNGFAAYCWMSHGDDYTSYAVGPRRSVAEIESIGWPYNLTAPPRPKPGPPPLVSEF